MALFYFPVILFLMLVILFNEGWKKVLVISGLFIVLVIIIGILLILFNVDRTLWPKLASLTWTTFAVSLVIYSLKRFIFENRSS